MHTWWKCTKGSLLLLLLLLRCFEKTSAFVVPPTKSLRGHEGLKTPSSFIVRRGLDEWKDMEVSISRHQEHDFVVHSSKSSPLRPVSILPIEYSKRRVPLPGDKTYLQFVEESEIQLFEMTLQKHEGIFAIGLVNDGIVNDDGGKDEPEYQTMLAKVLLVEIQDYYKHTGNNKLGVFCTAKILGKGNVHQVFWPKAATRDPFLALVNSVDDEFDSSGIVGANQVADGIELLLSYHARRSEKDSGTSFGEEDNDDDDRTLHDYFLDAYGVACQSDLQDYSIPLGDVQMLGQRSWRELKAVSWAAFAAVSSYYEEPGQAHRYHQQQQQRLEALYTKNTLQRLQLARNLLSGIRIISRTAVAQERRI